MPETQGDQNAVRPGVMEYLMDKKSLSILLVSRLATIICGLCAALPIFSGSTHPAIWYYRAHMANIGTSALRLVQAIQTENQPLGFNRATLSSLLSKDSCHYLIFSVMFMSASPVTISIIPILLFALLHVCSFLTKLAETCNINVGLLKRLMDKVTSNQVFLLQVIAINEVMLMPVIIITVFTGMGNIFLPFVYYRFIFLRYSSARNPYSRMVFMHLRISVEQLAASPKCPGIVGSLLLKSRDIVIRLCPQ